MLSYTVAPGRGSHRDDDNAPWLLVSHGAGFCKVGAAAMASLCVVFKRVCVGPARREA